MSSRPDPASHFARDNARPAADIQHVLYIGPDFELVKVGVSDGYFFIRLPAQLQELSQLKNLGGLPVG